MLLTFQVKHPKKLSYFSRTFHMEPPDGRYVLYIYYVILILDFLKGPPYCHQLSYLPPPLPPGKTVILSYIGDPPPAKTVILSYRVSDPSCHP